MFIAKKEVEESQFWEHFTSAIDSTLQTGSEGGKVKEIVCFGLGSISSSKTSQYQLALLLKLTQTYSCRAEVYDPIFNCDEKELLTGLGLFISPENCEGRKPANSCYTLFILPHCPRELSNNLLFANWTVELLHSCLIVGNSFEKLCLHTPKRLLKNYNYLLRIERIAQELAVNNNFHYTDIFNDLSIHYFPRQALEGVEADFWNNPQPIYPEDTELI